MEESTAAATQALVARAAERAGEVARELRAWAASAGRTLGEVAQQALAFAKEFGQLLLTGVCAVMAAGEPARAAVPLRGGRRATSVSARRGC